MNCKAVGGRKALINTCYGYGLSAALGWQKNIFARRQKGLRVGKNIAESVVSGDSGPIFGRESAGHFAQNRR
jgi:hypothetical protein